MKNYTERVEIRMEKWLLKSLDKWRHKEPFLMSRGAAIRFAVRQLLSDDKAMDIIRMAAELIEKKGLNE